ncbi:hypothetical protein [Lysobacter sp. HA18]
MNRLVGTFITLAARALTGPAGAQEQAPENAKKFLAQLGELGQMEYLQRFDGSDYDQVGYIDYSGDVEVQRTFAIPSSPATEFESPYRCETKFKHTVTTPDGTYPGEPESLSWSVIASVVVAGRNVEVTTRFPTDSAMRGESMYQRFTLPNAALAKRVGYAWNSCAYPAARPKALVSDRCVLPLVRINLAPRSPATRFPLRAQP